MHRQKSHPWLFVGLLCAVHCRPQRYCSSERNGQIASPRVEVPLPILHDTHEQVTTVEALLHAFKLRVASLHVASKLVAFMAMIKILLYC